MSYAARIARLFRLDEDGWRRHANPWSGWTRMLSAPLYFIALWSAHWIGWFCLIPIAAIAVWSWFNPRLWPPPAHYDAWISRAVLGERDWIETPPADIPARHRRGPHMLNAVGLAGVVGFAIGLIRADLALGLAGYAVAILAKIWFLDRMTFLHDDLKAARCGS